MKHVKEENKNGTISACMVAAFILVLIFNGCTPTQINSHLDNNYSVTKTSNCILERNESYPDLGCTPGAILTTDTSKVCTKGYSATVRNVPQSTKDEVYKRYGITPEKNAYEIDHLISLELGGGNDISNLWPEKYNILDGARDKDKIENKLHSAVCSGKITIQEAQYIISHDWKNG